VSLPVKSLQSTLMFANRARAYLNEAPVRCSTLGFASGLLRTLVIYGSQKFHNIGPCLFYPKSITIVGPNKRLSFQAEPDNLAVVAEANLVDAMREESLRKKQV
jgi:hypothetical protein